MPFNSWKRADWNKLPLWFRRQFYKDDPEMYRKILKVLRRKDNKSTNRPHLRSRKELEEVEEFLRNLATRVKAI